MARIKIDYGIDLGTTNSAICRMEKGKPIIIKSDALKDTIPSCVAFNKKKTIRIGDTAYNSMKSDKRRATKTWRVEDTNTYVEFKRTMATDTKYQSSNMGRAYSSEELSSHVLATLKSFVTDENIPAVVITVPAKFTVNQKTATMEAAKMAGFRKCELLQEPIAAAMAYGLTANEKDGVWMVFDFGGGTFDAALLKVEDGIMQVFDTEGDNYLGGKNLDYAIVDKIIIPHLQQNYAIDSYLADERKKAILRGAMKTYAEEVKNQLSFKDHEDIISDLGELGEDEDGEEIEIDLTVTQEETFEVMRPLFQKAVDICKNLLLRNHLSDSQLNKLILVGGPTHCPLIRQMLKEQITPNVDTSIDPMTVVAVGAALYASTIDAEVNSDDLAVETVKLDVGYESTSVEKEEWVSVRLPENSIYDSVYVELLSSDKAWSSGKVEIDKTGNVVEANLVESKPNSFDVLCYDRQGNSLPCFPNEITIIQGSKIGAAPLPYNIGIAVWDSGKESTVFRLAKGLEKNKPIPATGVLNNLKTTCLLRPGVDNDRVSIPVYQTDDYTGAEGRPVFLYEYVADVKVTGDDVDALIPEGSSVDITVKVDASEQMTIEVHFLASDETVEKRLDTGKKQSVEEAKESVKKHLGEAFRHMRNLSEAGIATDDLEEELEAVEDEARSSNEMKAVLQHLKEVFRKIVSLDESTEWQRLDGELREEFDKLEKAQNDLGNSQTARQVDVLRDSVDRVIRMKEIKTGQEVLEQVRALFFQLTLVYQCMGIIRHYDRTFSLETWTDPSRARRLIDQGLEIMNANPSKEMLLPIARGIIDMLPNRGGPDAGGILGQE